MDEEEQRLCQQDGNADDGDGDGLVGVQGARRESYLTGEVSDKIRD